MTLDKEIKYKIDKDGTLWIRKFKDLLKQRCPHGEGDCGVYCPKFQISKGYDDNYMEISLLCCGERYYDLYSNESTLLVIDRDITFDLGNKREMDFTKINKLEKLTEEDYAGGLDNFLENEGKAINEAIGESLLEDYKKVCEDKNQQKFVSKTLTCINNSMKESVDGFLENEGYGIDKALEEDLMGNLIGALKDSSVEINNNGEDKK